jgi:hypothetical protein
VSPEPGQVQSAHAEEVVETRRAEPVAEIGDNGFGGNGFALLVDFKSERLPPFGRVDAGVGMGG